MKKWISICIFTLCLIFSVNCVWAEGSLSEKQSEAISLMNDLKIYTDITEENASNASRAGRRAVYIGVGASGYAYWWPEKERPSE